VQEAVVLVLPLLMFADLFALRVYWNKWDMRYIKLMLPIGLIGMLMGAWVLVNLPDVALRRVLGFFTLTAVVYKLASDSLKSLQYTPRTWHAYFTGWAAGFGSAVANAGAPPFTAYMLLQKVEPTPFIGTTTLFFAIVNVLKLPSFIGTQLLSPSQLLSIAWTLPLIPLGVWLGRRGLTMINAKAFEWLMVVLLFWASFSLLFSGGR
jgi:uncharacterized membrane protein YfcA